MQAHTETIPGVRKIAVLRANGLGDLVFILPALDALRAAYPRAEIVLLGREWHAQFFCNRPGPVDRVIVVPHLAWIDAPPGVEGPVAEDGEASEAFFQAAAREGFDLAFQMHGGGRDSNPFVLRLGARMTLGLKSADAAPLDRWVPYVYFQPEILRYLEIVSLAGAVPDGLEPRIAVTPADVEGSLRAIPGDEPLVALNPGAGDTRRRWAPANFARVGDALAALGFRIALTGTPTDREIVAEVKAAMQHPAIDLCDNLSLGGLLGLLSRVDLVISNDSGPLHLAEAVDAATVGIYWCGNLITAGPLTRSRHRPLLSWRLTCPICGRNTIHDPCDHRASFVDDVTAGEVIAAAEDLLRMTGKLPPLPGRAA